MDGRPLARATIDVWHSTPEGRYSGIHDGIPPHYYRGKIVTDADGRYNVRSIMPIPYQIPNEGRSEEHTSELQSLMRISYAVFCLKKKKTNTSLIIIIDTTIPQIIHTKTETKPTLIQLLHIHITTIHNINN